MKLYEFLGAVLPFKELSKVKLQVNMDEFDVEYEGIPIKDTHIDFDSKKITFSGSYVSDEHQGSRKIKRIK